MRSTSIPTCSSINLPLPSLLSSLAIALILLGNQVTSTTVSTSNSQSSSSGAPSYLNQLLLQHDSNPSTSLNLLPPSILKSTDSNHHVLADLRRRGASVEPQSHLNVRAEAAGSGSNRRPQSSQDNQDDKAQLLGQMGKWVQQRWLLREGGNRVCAYNIALNLSSSPSQRTFVELDTGSADLWLISSTCSSEACDAEGLLKFDPAQSQTYKTVQIISNPAGASTNLSASANVTSASDSQGSNDANPLPQRRLTSNLLGSRIPTSKAATPLTGPTDGTSIPFSVTYGSSETASGALGSENIYLSGLEVRDQIFGLVDSTNLTLGTQGISGVLGMGFPRGSSISRTFVNFTKEELNGSDPNPLLSNLLKGNNVSYPLFSLALNRTGGKLTLGALDSNILTSSEEVGRVQWSDVVPFPSGSTFQANSTSSLEFNTSLSLINLEGPTLGDYVYWSLPLTGAGYNDSSIELSPTYRNIRNQVGSNTSIALLDSGTVGIVGSFQDVSNIYSKIPESRHVGDGVYYVPCSTTQRMYFQFSGGRNLTLEPEDYIIGPAASNPYACLSWPIAAAGTPDGVDWIFGQAFLRTVYSIFSFGIEGVESPKIGLYPLRQPSTASNYSSLFIPTSQESLSSFLQNDANVIQTLLPNSLVSLPIPTTTSTYQFINATITPSLGAFPTLAAGNLTINPLISAQSGDVNLPTIANSSVPLPAPTNPAQEAAQDSAAGLKVNSIFISGIAIVLSLQLYV